MRRCAAIVLLLAAAGPARAELASSSPTGFLSTHQRSVQATPQQAFDAIGRIERWWNAAHSYSGQAANLRLGLRAGDCFCEQWDGHSIEHARVIQVRPESTVRLEGALGPLPELAVKAILTFSTGVAEGKTFVRLSYRVSGGADVGLEKLAPLVDRVIADAFGRWSAHAESPARP